MADKQWVFGLSIDDEIVWGFAEVDITSDVHGREAYDPANITADKICNLPNANDEEFDLKTAIDDALGPVVLDSRYASALGHIKAVGVSTIGITDHFKKRLLDLRRKEVVWELDEDYILDGRCREISR